MGSVVPFRRGQRPPPAPPATDIDVTVLVFTPLHELRELLWRWPGRCPSDPGLLRRTLQLIGENLAALQEADAAADAEAQKTGWRDAKTRREHGAAMLEVLREFSPRDGAWSDPACR